MENVNLSKEIQDQAEALYQQAKAQVEGRIEPLSDATFMGNRANLIGSLIGAAAAVGVEYMREDSNKFSIGASIASSGLMIGLAYNELHDMENTYLSTGICGLTTFGISTAVSRVTAHYTQPATEEVVLEAETEIVQE